MTGIKYYDVISCRTIDDYIIEFELTPSMTLDDNLSKNATNIVNSDGYYYHKYDLDIVTTHAIMLDPSKSISGYDIPESIKDRYLDNTRKLKIESLTKKIE